MSKKTIVFATQNPNKLHEVAVLLEDYYKVIGLQHINCTEDIPETGDTLEENAIQKATYVFEKYGYECFADDTGLMVNALNGEPGVYSARYAGKQKNAEDNMNLLLTKLRDKKDRTAFFGTVIAFIAKSGVLTFEGKVTGEITENQQGSNGFGYDPVFKPTGIDKTFAELDFSEKNKMSHRARAIESFLDYLKTQNAD